LLDGTQLGSFVKEKFIVFVILFCLVTLQFKGLYLFIYFMSFACSSPYSREWILCGGVTVESNEITTIHLSYLAWSTLLKYNYSRIGIMVDMSELQ
jgi:hypothetical protein